MLGFIVVTHGRLAAELIATAELIVGKIGSLYAVSVAPSCSQEDARQQLEAAVKSADKGSGVLILTDLFGGTPSNLSISFLEDKRVEVVTGVNLPMMIKLPSVADNLDIDEVAKMLRAYGRENISIAGDLLKGG